MTATSIEWTDATWNPTRGCSRVSAGCDHCYAMREARRHDHPGGAYEGLTRINTGRTSHVGVDWKGVVRLVPEALDIPLRWRKPQRIFVNSMSDLFHESLDFRSIAAVFGVMATARRHTFQVLTKRPRRMLKFFDELRDHCTGWAGGILDAGNACAHIGLKLSDDDGTRLGGSMLERVWPLPNVWLGVSVEDQATADERIPLLLQTPAAVRFISLEPQLAHVDLRAYLKGSYAPPHHEAVYGVMTTGGQWLDWVIVGGESGPGARPFDVAWPRSTVAQCKAAGVPVFVKQMGRWIQGDHEGFLPDRWLLDDGRVFVPPIIGDRAFARPENAVAFTIGGKGGDMAEWSPDLRVREFPA